MAFFKTLRRRLFGGNSTSATYDGVGGGRRSIAWSVGNPIYAISGTGVLTNVAGTGNYLVGVATAVAANPSATGRVRLNGSLGHPVTA